MNIHKHMEAIFVGAIAIIGAGTIALSTVPEASADSSAPVAQAVPVERPVATAGTMAVVVVRAPRLPRE